MWSKRHGLKGEYSEHGRLWERVKGLIHNEEKGYFSISPEFGLKWGLVNFPMLIFYEIYIHIQMSTQNILKINFDDSLFWII